MAHRGRLNVLSNILNKSVIDIFSEFNEGYIQNSFEGTGDVKYHKGFSSQHTNRNGNMVHLNLVANPSHLEAVDPVVLGKTRAKQRMYSVNIEKQPEMKTVVDRTKILPFLIHGDAAFAGQGLVAETLNMSQLDGYRIGGTIHFVINNQIGFTTDPKDARSSAYCTDVAKMIEAPIFHVNGDDPEAVVYVLELALRYRQKFGKDVFIDMVCYRRQGHNEADEPAFTQPVLYKKIKNRPSVRLLYTDQLVQRGELDSGAVQLLADEFNSRLEKNFDQLKNGTASLPKTVPTDVRWRGFLAPFSHGPFNTAVHPKVLGHLAERLNYVPEGFHLNPKVARQLVERQKRFDSEGMVDWGFAEALAFGSLLLDKYPIRLSGQDCQRGTFSHRHSVWTDGESREAYKPLNHLADEQSHFCVYNSPLSEASVLGFDYGYSLAEPRMLIIWEAQFGDFANGAQMIIDQFISGSLVKWRRASGLVMLLPHGMEGQGPEHSNAYLERYLQACAQDNMYVCNITTPANYFHALRRQVLQPFRRPLIIMAPKSLLRHPEAVSPVSEMSEGGFQQYIDDPLKPNKAKRLIFCSGKLYYDLADLRAKEKVDNCAIIRIEQFYPIDNSALQKIVANYPHAKEIIWAQEETKNRGGWSFIRGVLQYLFPQLPIHYVGRGYAASPAEGVHVMHLQQQERIVRSAVIGETVKQDITILPEEVK